MVIVVGGSHPGVDRIVAAAASINPRIWQPLISLQSGP